MSSSHCATSPYPMYLCKVNPSTKGAESEITAFEACMKAVFSHGKLGCVYAVTITAMSIHSTERRKLSSPRHFKMRNGLCRLLFSTKQMLAWHT